MKRVIKLFLIFVFTCFSFYYTDKIIEFSKKNDPLMIKINEYRDSNSISFVNGILTKETMLVGSSGYIVDPDISYEKMKKLNKFNDTLLEYVSIKPNITKGDNLDKLIEGKNTLAKEISLIFVFENLDLYEQITYILNSHDVSSTFFMEGYLFEKNIDFINSSIGKSTIGLYGYNKKYDEVNMRYLSGLVKDNTNYSNYCLYINDTFLNTCVKYKINTIKPICISNNLYDFMKNDKKNGYIYQIDVNSQNIKELNSTIIYLKQKGYDVLNINKLLEE